MGLPEALLRRIEWQVLRRLDGQLRGAYRTAVRGVGTDFTGLREYTADDDVRHIDWNVTARLDEPYVRQYTEERELTAWLVLDRSASMRFRGGDAGKEPVLVELAVSLARLFTRAGNRVGAICFEHRAQRIIAPATGRNHVLRLAAELEREPDGGDGASTDLAAMLHLAAATVRRRSLVVVLSDFIGQGDWVGALLRLGQRHEVVTVRIVDPVESDLPDLGLVLVQDAETGEQLLVDTGDPVFRGRLRAEAAARERALTAAMRRAGVAAHRLGTGDDLVHALLRMATGPGGGAG